MRSLTVGKKLYVGNLTYRTNSSDLEQLFSQYGTVQSAEVISDRETGRSKGFGFVEMNTEAEAKAAIEGLHEHEVDGRRLTVNEARPASPSLAAAAITAAGRAVAAATVDMSAAATNWPRSQSTLGLPLSGCQRPENGQHRIQMGEPGAKTVDKIAQREVAFEQVFVILLDIMGELTHE